MNSSGFYKLNNDRLQYAATSVLAPNFTLRAEDHATYSYPVSGWYWFDSYEDAEASFSINGASNADWTSFKRALLMSEDVAVIMATARSQGCEPGVTALPLALEKAQAGDLTEFQACWQLVARAGQATTEQVMKLAGVAAACNLPSDIVATLSLSEQAPSPPPAVSLGQEWTAPDGTLWKVVQARTSTGEFQADEPSTPERESLAWAPVA